MNYQLRIALEGARPPIWRRILVESSISLGELHRVLQIVMGWEDYHLHVFVKDHLRFILPDPSPDPLGNYGLDERNYRLDQLLTEPKDWMRYVYDFGDDWSHKITLQKILPVDPKQETPVCLSGKRRCPPEDCGDDDYDPEEFDVRDVNVELRACFGP